MADTSHTLSTDAFRRTRRTVTQYEREHIRDLRPQPYPRATAQAPRMIPGIIVDQGPQGEPDYDDARYWVRLARCANTDGDTTTPVELGPYDAGHALERIVMVTNLPEQRAGTHAVPVGTYVTVSPLRDQSVDTVTRWHMSVSVGGGSAVYEYARIVGFFDNVPGGGYGPHPIFGRGLEVVPQRVVFPTAEEPGEIGFELGGAAQFAFPDPLVLHMLDLIIDNPLTTLEWSLANYYYLNRIMKGSKIDGRLVMFREPFAILGGPNL